MRVLHQELFTSTAGLTRICISLRVSMMLLLLLFVSIICPFCPCSAKDELVRMHAPGDIIIGGLFPVHVKTNRSTTPGHASCLQYDIQNFLRTQVMIFAIQEINQRKVLPNLTIGYDVYDTCGDVTFAIRATFELLKGWSDPHSCSALPDPHAKVVIGERYSEVSIAVARILTLSSVAQISYGSTSELLSRKLKFPTFLRTLSSDAHQTMAIAKLVEQFNWQTVSVVGSDDEYGKYGSEQLVDHFNKKKNVCIDFKEILPSYFSLNKSESREELDKLVNLIKDSPAEAIILFTKGSNVDIIMEAAILHKLNRTWIASDSWSTSTRIRAIPDIHKIGQVFGFISKRNEVPGFKDYVISNFSGTLNPFLQQYWIRYPPCSSPLEKNRVSKCSPTKSQNEARQCLDPLCLVNYIDQDESYNIYLAVRVIAEGLRHLLKCDSEKCGRNGNFTALELFQEIQKVNFTVGNTSIFFDANGNPSIGYDILQWNMTESNVSVTTIGEYWPSELIKLPNDLVGKMRNVTVSAANCSKTCAPGKELKILKRRCCKECIQCNQGYYSPGQGAECEHCNDSQYASPKRDKCSEKKFEYLEWRNPFVIILSFFEILGIISTILVSVVFVVQRNTPIVKAVGGYLCFLELLSLLACFCTAMTFTGQPTKASCLAGLPLFGLVFTLCISCILANLLQILVGFSFGQNARPWLKRLNYPLAVVAIVFGIQLTLCAVWMSLNPPVPEELKLDRTILLHCKNDSLKFFIATLGYNALLAFFCFLFAYKGKMLPDLYKNASFITISMLLYLVIWIIFIPIYTSTQGIYTLATEAAAILVSSYSILCCHLAPKCYIMVFKKEINNEHAITEHIKKHYEQKGMAVVPS